MVDTVIDSMIQLPEVGVEHMIVQAQHLAVQYWSKTQKESGIWFADDTWKWYDDTIGRYWLSNRFIIPMVIWASIIPLNIIFFWFFLIYNWTWCGTFTNNNGNSKFNFCLAPQPGSQKAPLNK